MTKSDWDEIKEIIRTEPLVLMQRIGRISKVQHALNPVKPCYFVIGYFSESQ